VGGLELSPLARHHHVDLTAGALRTDEPRTPFKDGHLRAVAAGMLSRIGFHLMAAFAAPDDEPRGPAAALPNVIGGPGSDFT
jgi:hypothetical protein